MHSTQPDTTTLVRLQFQPFKKANRVLDSVGFLVAYCTYRAAEKEVCIDFLLELETSFWASLALE